MKFVDEFRDPAAARKLLGAIEHLAGSGPDHFKFMEVCGGHTHTIYRHGIEHLLPDNVELVHGPGCPVCVIPMGRIDDAMWLAGQPDVIFTCFGDMMRVPGSQWQPARCQSARRRRAVRLLAAGCAEDRGRQPRQTGGVLRHRIRDHRAVDGGDPGAGTRPGSDQFQCVLQPRHDRAADQGHPGITRPAAVRLHRPGARIDRGGQPAVPVRPRRCTESRWW